MEKDAARLNVATRRILEFTVLGALYVLGGKLGLALAFQHGSASAVWPPTGIALAAVLLLGNRVWPAIAAGAFLVNLANGSAAVLAAAIAAGNTLEAVVGGWSIRRFAGGHVALRRPQGVLRFALLAAAVTTISASVGTFSLWLGGPAQGPPSSVWLTWWTGDTVGALVFTPLLLLWARPDRRTATSRSPLEMLALVVTVLGIGGLVFTRTVPIAFGCLPPLIWAALRFGPRFAASAAVVLSGIALWGTLQGLGPFAVSSQDESLLFLQGFVGIATLTALVLAAAVDESARVQGSLARARAALEDRVRERTASLARAVEELRSSRAVLSEAQRVTHIGSWEWDVGGDRVEWSDELYRIYGLEPGAIEMTYAAYLERVHDEDRDRAAAAIRAALEGGSEFEFEERVVRPDGSVRVLQSKGRVVRDEAGRATRMIGTCHDITERKEVEIELARRMEALDRTNAELSMLSYAASHDLREPLRSVSGHTQLIRRRLGEAIDPEIRRSIGFTVDAVRRMDELIEDLLEYSSADRQVRREVDARKALDEALDRLAIPIREAEARIEAADLPQVAGDPARLVRLFQNLVSNALKYRKPGGRAEIRVAAEPSGGMWRFSVADNGRGFAPEEAERVFVLFERVDVDPKIPGTGLGLAICRRIVEAQGGRIWAESEPGRGSVFRFTLPPTPSTDTAGGQEACGPPGAA